MTIACIRHIRGRNVRLTDSGFFFLSAASHSSSSRIWMLNLLCRLIVSAKPLNITYNPAAICQVLEYFSVRKSKYRPYDIESHLAC